MTLVKICGNTSVEDALTAVEAGADALGFIFYEKSPRNIIAKSARDIIKRLPSNVESVGVFVEGTGSSQEWYEIASAVGLSALQVHVGFNNEDPALLIRELAAANVSHNRALYVVLPAARLLGEKEGISLFERCEEALGENQREKHALQGVFLDSGTAAQPGGTGKIFDWQKAVPLVESMRLNTRVVISGGLNPSNVSDAIRILKPWGVDVVSGVEASPGKKDPAKVRAFVKAVRMAEKNT
ncbi:MAG: phosphoribosylanthranilate isomerase [Terriglobales bacterium]